MKKSTTFFLMIVALCLISQSLYSNGSYEQIISHLTNSAAGEKETHEAFPVKRIDTAEPGLTSYLAGTTCSITPASTAICSGTSVTINYTTSNVWTSTYPGTAQYSTNGGGSWINMAPNTTNSFSYTPATTTSYCVRVLNNDGTVACGPTCTTITVYTISSSTPALSSPANYAYLYSPSVNFTWTHTTGTHPSSRYDIEIDGNGTWISTGTAKTYNTTVAAGTHTWRVRYYDGCSGVTYTSGFRTFYYYSTTTCGDVDHLGQNWTIAANTTLQGNHINVGTFTVNSGITITVDPNCHYFNVSAQTITINGTINGNGAGGLGGAGGIASSTYGSCSNSDNNYYSGGYGHSGANGSGAGAGQAGTNGGNGWGYSRECGNFLCDGNRDGDFGGGGGAGSGSGGGYGGAGGSGSYGAAGLYFDEGWDGGGAGGNGKSGGIANGSNSDIDITWGSGGGGAGGGGASFSQGGAGGSGGAGGGCVKLVSSGNLTLNGAIYCNGTNGGAGGYGGTNSEGDYECSTSSCGSCGLCSESTYYTSAGAGGGAGGGSGGGILLQACGTMNIAGTLNANGGNGGAAGYPDPSYGDCHYWASGGGGGGGGRIKIVRNPCNTYTNSGTISYSGGAGGTYYYGTGNSGSDGSYNESIDHPNYTPLTGGSISGNQEVCVGGDPAAFTSTAAPTGGNCATARTYQWMSCTSGCTSPPTNFTVISGATAATYNVPSGIAETTYFVRRVTSGSCVAYSNVITVTVVPDPVSPTATKSPDVAEVCAGQTLSLADVVDNGGGTGTCTIQYRHSTNGGSSYSAWSTTPSSFAAVAGNTNIIQIRKNCTGSGCGYSVENSYSWTVVADPATPTATKSPADASVCEGQTLSLTNIIDNGGGTGTCNIYYRYASTLAGLPTAAWSTTIPSVTASTGSLYIEMMKSCNGNGCNDSPSSIYSWTIVSDPSAPTATKSPIDATVCEGQTLTLTGITDNGGGTGTCNIEYSYSTDGGSNYSSWGTSLPSFAAVAGNNNIIKIRKNCTGSGCDISSENSYSWSVVDDPKTPSASMSPSATTVCAGQTLTLTDIIDNGGGTGTCNIEYCYSTNGGSSFSLWSTSLPSFSAVAGFTNIIKIRKNCDGSQCDISSEASYSWTVVIDPTTPSATKSPDVATVCTGEALSLTNITDNGGGTGTCNIEYCYSTDGGNNYTAWSTSVPSFSATGSDNRIKIRKNCNGNGCDISSENTYSWNVDPTSAGGSIVADPATGICAGTTATLTLSGYTGTIQWQTNSSGSWQNISGETAITYTTPPLAITTSYRAVVTSGVCASDNSSVSTVTVVTPDVTGVSGNDYIWTGAINTDWNGSTTGNWLLYSGTTFSIPVQVPTGSSNVFIRAYESCFTTIPVVSTINVATCNNLSIESGNSLQVNAGGNLTINGNLSNSGNLTMVGTSDIISNGNWINDGIFSAGSGTVTFNGTSIQEIQSGGNAFNKVVFSNSASGITDIQISEPLTIDGSATFNNGVVYFTGTGSILFGNSATSDIGNTLSYVNGTISKSGITAFSFAIGENDVWAPVGIAAPVSFSTISANYNFVAGPQNWSAAYMCNQDELHHTSGVEHWELTSTAATPAVTLYWADGTRSGIENLAELRVAHYNESTHCWESKGGSTSGDLTSGSISSTLPFNSYSPITFGTKTNDNPLPVELLNFEGFCTNGSINLQWITSSEINNDHFEIERSVNGSDWKNIGSVDGAGNSNSEIQYTFADRNILEGVIYYRLRQVDYDGSSKLSDIIQVRCAFESLNPIIFIYPNPFSDELTMDIENWNMDQLEIEMFDILGKKIGQWTLKNVNSHVIHQLNPGNLPPAMYLIKIKTSDGVVVRKVEKK